jgi:hypothetical protein
MRFRPLPLQILQESSVTLRSEKSPLAFFYLGRPAARWQRPDCYAPPFPRYPLPFSPSALLIPALPTPAAIPYPRPHLFLSADPNPRANPGRPQGGAGGRRCRGGGRGRRRREVPSHWPSPYTSSSSAQLPHPFLAVAGSSRYRANE